MVAANPIKTTAAKAPKRVPMSAACRTLGISRDSFRRHWLSTFTPYESDGGHHRVSEDELLEALRYTKPTDARAAVMMLRRNLGRI